MYAASLDFLGSSCFIGHIATPTRTLPARTRHTRARRGVRTSAEPLERRVLLSVLYVDDTAPGPTRDGASWATAYTDLQQALNAAAATSGSDEIRVAAGTYRPTAGVDRLATFRLQRGVSILGGYPDGGGTTPVPADNLTTLSGDIGTAGSTADNSYHVVTAAGVDGTAVLDGLTITGGNANGGGWESVGGGMYIGIYSGNASPTVTRCTFTANMAEAAGGAVHNANGSPSYANCTFSGNSAGSNGGGVSNGEGASSTLTNCTFSANSAQNGGGISNYKSSATVTGCVFSGNSADQGGGVFGTDSSATFTHCTFSGNSARFGGGIDNSDNIDNDNNARSLALTNCTFTGNSASWIGGGMAAVYSSPTLTNTTFEANTAADGGAGMYNHDASPTLTNCAFRGNSAGGSGRGGGMYNYHGSSPALINCAFTGNSAGYGGALSDALNSSPTLTNCTFAANTATSGAGGAISNDNSSAPSLSNCVFAANVARGGAEDLLYGGGASARYSLLRFGWPGEGNLSGDPWFARTPAAGPDARWGTDDDDYGDLRLQPRSPAMDTGDTSSVPAGVTSDLAGQPRVQGPAVDMGAYERPETAVYQAEQAAVTGARVSAARPGFTGSGYVDYQNATGDVIEFVVNAPSAGRYELAFRYANGGTADRTLSVLVDRAAGPGTVTFARTASWGTWDTAAVTAPLVAGANKVRLLATGQSGPNVDLLAVSRVPPVPSVTYQAESATLSGPLALSNHVGFTGSGFADFQKAAGDYAEFSIDVPADGAYSLGFRYANGSAADRPLDLSVDGRVLTGRVSFAPTGAWRAWDTASRTLTLPAGRHLVRLTAAGSNGPNLDALTVSPTVTPPPPVEPVTLQAEAAALDGPVVASNVPGYTGTGFADYQHGSGDSVEFTYTAPRAGDYVLTFRYANGSTSDRPLELRVNGAVALRNLSFAPTGAWRTWGLASPTVALAAGVNRIRLTTTGSNGPNLDALTVQPAEGIIYLSQARSVAAELNDSYWWTDREGNDVLIENEANDEVSAPGFGEFDGSVGWYFGGADELDDTYLDGTQHSRLTDGGVELWGGWEANVRVGWGTGKGGFVFGSDLDVTFKLDRPRTTASPTPSRAPGPTFLSPTSAAPPSSGRRPARLPERAPARSPPASTASNSTTA